MSDRYDVVVVGGGHNGLTTAALLARRGRSVLVLEQSERLGGLAASDEFHPGYRSAGLLQDSSGVRSTLLRELDLERHGLAWRDRGRSVLCLDGERGLLLDPDPARTAEEIAPHSPRDAERYGEFHELLDGLRPALRMLLDRPPVNLVDFESNPGRLLRVGLGLRRLGRRRLLELLRIPPQPVVDWLGEWFEMPWLRAVLALPAVAGTFCGPRSPGTSTNLLLAEGAAGTGVVRDGPGLVDALARAATGSGATLRTAARVRTLRPGANGLTVVLESGDEIAAATVAVSCSPRQLFLELLPPGTVSSRLEQRMLGYRCRGTTAHLLFALSAPPRFGCRPEMAVEFARTGAHPDEIERAFDAIKYRRFADRPVLEIHVPTVGDPGLAPAGHAVVSVLAHFAPYRPDDGWDDAGRERLADRVQAVLEEQAPGLSDSIVARVVRTPADLERLHALPGGQIHHGEHALDQLLVRPAPECIGYRTPVPGLWLCGSGSHPGGGLTCAPGALAAAAIAS